MSDKKPDTVPRIAHPNTRKADEARKRQIKQKMGLVEPKNLPTRAIHPVNVKKHSLKRTVDVEGGPLDKVLPGIVLVLGTSMSGKTTWIINAVLQKAIFGKLFDILHIVSPTIAVDDAYQYLIDMPESKLHQNFTDDTMKQITGATTEAKQNGKELHQGLIIDDGVSSDVSKRGNPMQSFASVARHYTDMTLISTQDLRATALPKFRNQVRLYVIMRKSAETDRRNLFRELGAYFGGEKNLERLFKEATDGDDPYAFMLLNVPNQTAWKGFDEILAISTQHHSVRNGIASPTHKVIYDVISGTSFHNTKSVKRKGKKRKLVRRPFTSQASGGHVGSIAIGAAAATSATTNPYLYASRNSWGPTSSRNTQQRTKATYGPVRYDKTLGSDVRRGPYGAEAYSKELGRWMPLSSRGRPVRREYARPDDELKMDVRDESGVGHQSMSAQLIKDRMRNAYVQDAYGQSSQSLDELLNTGYIGQQTSAPSPTQTLSDARELTSSTVKQVGELKNMTDVHRENLMKALKAGGINDQTTTQLALDALNRHGTDYRSVDYDSLINQARQDAPARKIDQARQKGETQYWLKSTRSMLSHLPESNDKYAMQATLDAIASERDAQQQDSMMSSFDEDHRKLLQDSKRTYDAQQALTEIEKQRPAPKPKMRTSTTQTNTPKVTSTEMQTDEAAKPKLTSQGIQTNAVTTSTQHMQTDNPATTTQGMQTQTTSTSTQSAQTQQPPKPQTASTYVGTDDLDAQSIAKEVTPPIVSLQQHATQSTLSEDARAQAIEERQAKYGKAPPSARVKESRTKKKQQQAELRSQRRHEKLDASRNINEAFAEPEAPPPQQPVRHERRRAKEIGVEHDEDDGRSTKAHKPSHDTTAAQVSIPDTAAPYADFGDEPDVMS
ncbi:hypothetical protein PTSG_03894 [Salpingoeca rosetta]|uniref:Uncharacterized protein n=1 Tax=Salpingoeca rosetta (strain ATCC 50818 / BSB-021) TaxID=946362 RepID=F2U5P8_SALR5|nr:uncharacterized protein PTSG_03894 [Salpingoeca rosetta]EGD83264.1 hypothetical protein PTSG_03894 [Salpingoeca rosetta]|eukprot:XP_004995628.1 hypothetical protein PTSG_03894 [Salpingoeca rosetta]